MRAKGISYETGWVRGGAISREDFDPAVVERELRIIRDDLHCSAVRILGGDPDRLELAASCAADLGLEVWFSPYPLELAADDILALFADCADRAERLRRDGAEVVFVAGAELSLMGPGFLPGGTLEDRVRSLAGSPRKPESIAELGVRINEFLSRAAAVVRARFGGRVTYAAVPVERVDWDLFDIVSVDLYRNRAIADRFRGDIRTLVGQGKPVAITEFGAATFRGAADIGAQALDAVEWDDVTGAPLRLKDEHARDEAGQAGYLRELLEVFDSEGVDSTFVFAFALHDFPHRPDGNPRDDLDLASFGVVATLDGRSGTTYPGLPWEPKAAFTALAEIYA